jgi:thymidylate synthase
LKQYHDLLLQILEHGEDSMDRTGTGTRSIFGAQLRFNLAEGFPAITTKKLAWKSVVSELLWFLEGSSDERRLAEIHYGKDAEELIGKTTIWTANADAQGKALGYENTDTVKELGPVYGVQWRYIDRIVDVPFYGNDNELLGYQSHAEEIDQISQVLNDLETNPYSRRHIVSAWNVGDIDKMALPPCHLMFQFYVRNNKLSCKFNMRSCDVFLGLPFNIASYALLTHIIADHLGYDVGDLIADLGDTHIYHNHFDQVKEQLSREEYPLPKLKIDVEFHLPDLLNDGCHGYHPGCFTLEDYQSHGSISAPMAV